MTPETALLVASGLHLGFQAVVTVVVYPALAATRAADWDAVHAAHSRRISVVVGPLYLAVAAACLWVLAAGPHSAPAIVAVSGHAVAACVTAVFAAPSHGRLGRAGAAGPERSEIVRLQWADRVRLLATVVALAAALLV
jgi:tetrahydromethanopterin S-methyltransferase subunit E